jgi:GNAT superfamily N-acetyltransferase
MTADTPVLIRAYDSEDSSALARLITELGYPTDAHEMAVRMTEIQANPNYKTLIATHQNEVVGMIGMVKSFFWEQNGFYIRIQALVVKQSYRNQGVGKLLIAACENYAQEIQANAVILNCGNREERKNAHIFYQKMGFKPKSTGYVKDLTD